MKKLSIILLILFTTITTFAQRTERKSRRDRVVVDPDLLRKSKSQRTGAIVMQGVGGVLLIVAVVMTVNDVEYLFDTEQNNNESTENVLAISGLALELGAIPLYIAAAKNGKKAYGISFKNEPSLYPGNRATVFKGIPSISFRLSL